MPHHNITLPDELYKPWRDGPQMIILLPNTARARRIQSGCTIVINDRIGLPVGKKSIYSNIKEAIKHVGQRFTPGLSSEELEKQWLRRHRTKPNGAVIALRVGATSGALLPRSGI